MKPRLRLARGAVTAALALAAAAASVAPAAAQFGYQQVNLVTDDQQNLINDGYTPAAHVDPNLVNPWGISFGATSPFWVSDNGTGLSTLYNGQGVPQSLVVTIPPPAGSPAGTTAAPTGQVFNGTANFGGAFFLFATEDGTISAWSGGTNAVLKVDNSASGAVYKGLAISGNSLYATNFNSGNIDVFDSNFNPVGSFTDPNAPAGYAPFGIQRLSNGNLLVTYAEQDAAKHDDVAGTGHGFVDIFNPTNDTFTRLITGSAAGGTVDALNSPWGLTLAPSTFGTFSDDLLVGNFGNGEINAFDPNNGALLGTLADHSGRTLVEDGLWAMTFGNGGRGGSTDTLYFTAGINGESHGLFGSIAPAAVPEPGTYALLTAGLLPLAALARRRSAGSQRQR